MRRRGFTLVEMVVAMTLTLVVFAITLPFVRTQSRALADNAGRLDADQVARYAQRLIDKELRLAVADPGQPLIVYAGPMGIAFNANLVARDTTDPGALELEPSADSTLSEAWRAAQAGSIPLTSRTYPTTTYTDAAGAPSRNETVMYFLRPDTVTGRSDVYVLYRRVNGRDSTQIVRNLHVPADSAFFRYFTAAGDTLAALALTGPLFWDSTRVASIRAVRIRPSGFFRNAQTGEDVIRPLSWTVMLGNRTNRGRDCGAAPAAPVALAWYPSLNSYPKKVEVAFDGSPDDSTGATDVTHYLVERRRTTDTAWQILGSVPASRRVVYGFVDAKPLLEGQFIYGIRAVDCGGAVSSRLVRPGNASVSLP